MGDVINRLQTVLDSMGRGNTVIDFVSARVAISDAIEDLAELDMLRAEDGKRQILEDRVAELEAKLAICGEEKQELIAALEQAWVDRDEAQTKAEQLQQRLSAFAKNV